MKQVGNTILAKGVNHILAKRDNSAWPKGSKLSGFSMQVTIWEQTSCFWLHCFAWFQITYIQNIGIICNIAKFIGIIFLYIFRY